MLRIRARHNKSGASLLATGLCCAYRKAATAATEEMRSIFEGNPLVVFFEIRKVVRKFLEGIGGLWYNI